MAHDRKKDDKFGARDDGMIENIISIDRVARVVKGGRRFRFRALAVVGDGKNKVGVGTSKGGDIQVAIQKAVNVAKKNMVEVAIENETIPHETQEKHAGSVVLLKPASEGTGLIAGGTVRAILETIGLNNVLSKSLGSSNKINTAYATIKALEALEPKKEWLTTKNFSDGKETDVKPAKEKSKSVSKKTVAKKKALKKTEAKK